MSNVNYGGFWYNEENSSITLCTLTVTTSGDNKLYYPNLFKVDLGTNVKRQIFPASTEDISVLVLPTAVAAVRHENPVITYNKDTKMYNVSFLLFGNSEGVWMYSIDIVERGKYSTTISGTPIIHTLNLN